MLMAVLGTLAVWGIAESVAAIGLVTLLEIGGLVAILVAATPAALAGGLPEVASDVPAAVALPGFLGAVTIAFFAFIGFEDMVNVVEEVKRPERNMPLAIGLTLAVTTLLYVALAAVSLAVATPAELSASEAPLGLVFGRASGLSAAPFLVVASLATVNGVLVLVIMASRVLYGLARDGAVPALLGRVWARTGTPVPATLLSCAIVLAGALLLPIGTLAQAGSVLTLAIFCLVNLALAALKRRAPAGPGRFAVPRWWPWIACAACAAVLAGEALRLVA
jgi:amino acid transporter